MKKADQWSGLVLLLIAGCICWGSILLPYGNIHNPGPGFYPLWLGIILAGMAIALLIRCSWPKGEERTLQDILADRGRWDKVLFILLALAVYGYLLDIVGFLIVTFLLLIFLLRFVEPHAWKSVIGWSLAGSLGSYVIFELWMKLRLPKGFLGI